MTLMPNVKKLTVWCIADFWNLLSLFTKYTWHFCQMLKILSWLSVSAVINGNGAGEEKWNFLLGRKYWKTTKRSLEENSFVFPESWSCIKVFMLLYNISKFVNHFNFSSNRNFTTNLIRIFRYYRNGFTEY